MEALAGIPPKETQLPKKKWFCLIGILRIAVPEISGAEGIFSRLQHALKAVDKLRVHLMVTVHDELTLWCYFINSMSQ